MVNTHSDVHMDAQEDDRPDPGQTSRKPYLDVKTAEIVEAHQLLKDGLEVQKRLLLHLGEALWQKGARVDEEQRTAR